MRVKGWCITIALFAIATLAVIKFQRDSLVNEPQRGTTYRWYDGTREKVEFFYNDDKSQPREQVLYGEDGTTIVSHKRYSYENKLQYEMTRLENGRSVVKQYDYNGNLSNLQLISADGHIVLVERQFQDGKLMSEDIRKENAGAVLPVSSKRYRENGLLQYEFNLDENGTITERSFYDTGKLESLAIKKLAGTTEVEITKYQPDGETLAQYSLLLVKTSLLERTYYETGKLETEKLSKLNDTNTSVEEELREYYKDGKTLFCEIKSVSRTNGSQKFFTPEGEPLATFTLTEEGITVEFYEKGKLSYRQKWQEDNLYSQHLVGVDLFDDAGKLKQSIEMSNVETETYPPQKLPKLVTDYSADGKISSKREIDKDGKSVVSEETFDAGGKSQLVVHPEDKRPVESFKESLFATPEKPRKQENQ